ncbi:MAG: insulinase family protein [Flavobacteriaceae bacterium]|nr:insulinase family protein [Flavobacteriaceae bacterium]
MKTKIALLIAVLTLSFSVSAQIDRSIQPKPGPAPKVKLGKAETFTLDNGLKVIIVENHKLPRASASLTIDNKPYVEGDKVGVSQLMGGLLGRGTKNITKDEFNEKVDYLGANVSFYSSGANARSLKKYFSEVLSLMADGVKNSNFTKEEFDKQVKITLVGIKSNEKSVTAVARRVESALIFGKNHPSGEFVTKKSIENISLEDVKNNYNAYYKPNNAYLVIVGDVNTKKIKKQVISLFSNWEKGTIPTTTVPAIKNVAHTEINFINMDNAVQSEIVIANTINLKLGDKKYYAALLANSILGGGGTARLFMNLREDKGYTYGSYSSIRQSRYAASFRASASVRNIVTDSSVVELQKEINKIRFQKVTAEELKNSKAEYIGSFVMNVQKPSTAARFALNIAMYNLPKDYYENYLANINAVTLQEVQDAAHQLFTGNKARIIITGKGIDVLKNLEKLKYKINYFDKNANPTTKPKMNMPIPAGLTATNVVDSYFKAIGGADKAHAIKSIMTSSDAKVQGMEINLTTKIAAPNKTSIVVFGMGQTLSRQVFDGSKGYAEQQGRRTDLTGEKLKEAKENSGLFKDDSYKSGKLDRIENLDGKAAYVIISGKTEAYYDVKSGLKVKEVVTSKAGGKEVKNPVNFSDYKTVNGIKFPHKISMKMGPMSLEFIVKEIKINEGVTDADFK